MHISLEALEPQDLKPRPLLYGTLLTLPALCFGIGWGIKRRIDRLSNNSALVRSQKALGTFNKELKILCPHLQNASVSDFYRLSARVFKDFLGDKFTVTGSALTADETAKKLCERGIDQKIINRTHDLLKEFERAQFASSTKEIKNREEIILNMKSLAKRLEKNFP